MNKANIKEAILSLEPLFEKYILGSGIVGSSIIFISGEDTLYKLNLGVKCKESDKRPDENTLYMIGSCSKSYASVAIMQLVDEGLLSLNDPVNRYIPFKLGKPDMPILIRHILTHTSGIPNLGMSENLVRKQLGIPYLDVFSSYEKYFEYLNGATDELIVEPGSKYIYSNDGYTLAAAVVSSVSGMKYEDYISEKIFKPLGMKRSIYFERDLKGDSNISCHYDNNQKKHEIYFEPIIAGCGGIISCAKDQSQYLKMFLNKGKNEGKKILSENAVNSIQKTYINHRTGFELFGEGFGLEGYGLGWFTYDNFHGSRIITHSGSTGIGSSNLFLVPEYDLGIAFLGNHSAGEGIFPMLGFMLVAKLKGINPMSVFPYFVKESQLTELQGLYSSYKGSVRIKISYSNGMLWLQYVDMNKNHEKQKMPLIPHKDNFEDMKFRLYTGPNSYRLIQFETDSKNNQYFFLERNLLKRRNN